MPKIAHTIKWWVFGAMCVSIGLYPIIYFVIDRHFGLLSTKSQEILTAQVWNIAFYFHIVLGGLSLLIGWVQFIKSFRAKRINLHRTVGKIYVIAALLSGVSGIYIAQFASGGITNVIGFSLSGIIFVIVTLLAYTSIKAGKIALHQKYMTYSYALCFSAVTLRIWLPLLVQLTGDFFTAYKIVGWLSWIPNLMVAFWLIRKQEHGIIA